MHSFILRLECKDILSTIAPRFPVMRVNMRKHMRDAVLEVANRIGIRVEISRAVPAAVEVRVRFKGVVTVDGDEKLDTVLVCFDHDIVKTVEDCVVPVAWAGVLEAREGVYVCAFLRAGLACDVSRFYQVEVRCCDTIEPHAQDLDTRGL